MQTIFSRTCKRVCALTHLAHVVFVEVEKRCRGQHKKQTFSHQYHYSDWRSKCWPCSPDKLAWNIKHRPLPGEKGFVSAQFVDVFFLYADAERRYVFISHQNSVGCAQRALRRMREILMLLYLCTYSRVTNPIGRSLGDDTATSSNSHQSEGWIIVMRACVCWENRLLWRLMTNSKTLKMSYNISKCACVCARETSGDVAAVAFAFQLR